MYNKEDFNPKIHGKKYSKRLYDRIKKNGFESVYLMSWCNIRGDLDINAKAKQIPSQQMAIGQMIGDAFVGQRITQAVSSGASKGDFFFSTIHGTKKWIDITEHFWRNYKEKGVCFYSQREHKLIEINKNSKRCEYCQAHFKREVVTIKKIERYVQWNLQDGLRSYI